MHAQGGRVLRARGYASETNLAYGAILEALRCGIEQIPLATWRIQPGMQALAETARLAPELRQLFPDLPAPVNLEGPGAQYLFFEGVAQVLLAMSRGSETSAPTGVLFLDDMQWIDPASLDLLAYLSRRLDENRLLILTTWSTDMLEESRRLHALLADASRQNLAMTIELERLRESQIEELLRMLESEGKLVSGEWRRRVVEETEGLPLFLVAYLHAAGQSTSSEPIPQERATNSWAQPLAGVRGMLQSRLALLDASTLQILQTAAVIGRSFDYDTVQAAAGRSEDETILALENLAHRGLVHEIGYTPDLSERRILYDFSHAQMRELVYENTSLARRRLLHRRVAESLSGSETRPDRMRDAPALAGQIATHYRYAGQSKEAARYERVAGEHARRLYANKAAIQHFETALALGAQERGELHGGLGDLQTLEGNYAAAIHHYTLAGAHSLGSGLAEIERRLGLVYDRMGEFGQAELHYLAALGELGENPAPALRAHLLADWSLTAHRRGEPNQAQRLAEEAMEAAYSGMDDPGVLMQLYNLFGILARSRGETAVAREHLAASLTQAERTNNLPWQIAALNNLALVHGDMGDFETAIHNAESALKLCNTTGDLHREAALRNNLADLLQAAGRVEEAQKEVERAVRLFTQVGVDLGQWQPEVWKLVEW